MNSAGQGGDGKSYRVILLLVVGLTAFSSAMKELNELREFTRDANTLVASWSNVVAPVEAPIPNVVIPVETSQPVEKVEICESSHTLNQAVPVAEVNLGGSVAPAKVKIKDVGKTVVAERSARGDAQVAALRSHRSADIEMVELRKQVRREGDLRVMIMADNDGEAEIAIPSPADLEIKLPKLKIHRQIPITPEEREILKSLSRSLNLRSAG